MNPRSRICLSLYRRLASAFPHEFRMLYGEDLDRLGEDAIPEIGNQYGLIGLLRLLADIAFQLPATYLAEIRQDVIYALRKLAQAPGFTSVALLSLAIGIGMCCVVFSQYQSIVGPPAGVRDPLELTTIRTGVSYPYFERYRDQHSAATSVMALLPGIPFAVALPHDKSARADRVYGHLVSPEYFTTLGVTPAAGRFFDPSTEKPGAAPVVVVSDRFWRTHLGADPHVVGEQLRVNGSMVTIIGIGPKDFRGIWPQNPADIFVPVTSGVALAPELSGDALHNASREMFRVVLRLPRGVTPGSVEATLDAATRNLDRENAIERDREGRVIRLMPAGTFALIRPEQRALFGGFDVVLWALVLSLMCANLANLLLARGTQRRREMAIRLSVGASRARLVRQSLTESVLLSGAGGLLGVLLAYWITNAISSLPMPATMAVDYRCQPDLGVVAVTLAIALAAGIGFGLAPALSLARTDIGVTLKEGAQAPVRGYRRFGLRNILVVSQMTASLTLLLVTWFVTLIFLDNSLEPGFEIANLNLIALDPVRDGYSASDAATLMAKLPEELSRADAVQSVALTSGVPFGGLGSDQPNTRVSAPAADAHGNQILHAIFREPVGANYFATLGIPLVAGREFDQRDQRQNAPGLTGTPAIVNQTAARELFGTANPIGGAIREGGLNYTVVGLTRDVQSGLLMPKPVATVFVPLTDEWFHKHMGQTATLLVRGAAGRNPLASVREQMAIHPDLTVFNARTLQSDLDRMNAFVRWNSTIYVALGLFATLLAAIGLGGVTAYAVAQRRKEIGIRMALGARAAQVQALVLREGTVLVMAGMVFGLAGSIAMMRVLSAYWDAVAGHWAKRADNPWVLMAAPVLLSGLAMLSCYLPARRAMRIDPMSALRDE